MSVIFHRPSFTATPFLFPTSFVRSTGVHCCQRHDVGNDRHCGKRCGVKDDGLRRMQPPNEKLSDPDEGSSDSPSGEPEAIRNKTSVANRSGESFEISRRSSLNHGFEIAVGLAGQTASLCDASETSVTFESVLLINNVAAANWGTNQKPTPEAAHELKRTQLDNESSNNTRNDSKLRLAGCSEQRVRRGRRRPACWRPNDL